MAQGGTTVLTEVPEMFGAETLLMNRCATRELFDQTVRLINDFKEYFIRSGMPVYENPSPGNKAGGISTLEEKSLGCTQKSGKSAVRGVLRYGERLSQNGLNLLSAPGNGLDRPGGCRLPDRPVYHRPRHPVRHVRPDDENRYEFRPGPDETRVDRL